MPKTRPKTRPRPTVDAFLRGLGFVRESNNHPTLYVASDRATDSVIVIEKRGDWEPPFRWSDPASVSLAVADAVGQQGPLVDYPTLQSWRDGGVTAARAVEAGWRNVLAAAHRWSGPALLGDDEVLARAAAERWFLADVLALQDVLTAGGAVRAAVYADDPPHAVVLLAAPPGVDLPDYQLAAEVRLSRRHAAFVRRLKP